MKNIRLKTILGIFLCSCFSIVNAQLAAEKTHDVSKKSRNGYLGNVVVDDVKKQFDMVFVTKSTNKKIQFDVYQYDYDLNLINEFSDEQEVEKARTKYKWFGKSYKGDEYKVTELQLGGITASKLQLVENTYKYGWLSGKYKKKVKVLNEVKSKDLFGKPMWNPRQFHYNNPATGNLIYVNAVVDNKSFAVQKYVINRINTSLEKTIVKEFEIGYYQRVMYSGPIVEGGGDMIAIFADAGGKGVYKPKNNQSPTPTRWTYVRMAADGTLKEKIHFNTKALNWLVSGAREKDGIVYIYGAGESNGVGEKHQKLLDALGTGKQDVFQVVKIADGKPEFVSAPTLDDFEQKSKKPASQKKHTYYTGKKVEIRGINITSSGDIFINAQDYSVDATGKVGGNIYKDLFMFHFSKDGALKSSYGIESTQKKGGVGGGLTDARFHPTDGEIVESADGKRLYWMLFPVKKIFVHKERSGNYEYTYYIPRIAPRAGSIDISSGDVSEFKEFGEDKFYLFNSHPFISIEGGKQIIYLGEGGEKGKEIWLGKFDPTTL
ncbi:MAG: hypothetical protein MRY83_16895 [Flavobacteriales bacterium]|nr:hypothetical protein [Flavobacteriales bacterium]